MSVYEAHGLNIDQLSNYTTINTIDDFSIAVYKNLIKEKNT